MQKQKKPFSLMAFIRPHRAGFITSTVLAVLSVASGMVPYFAVARMVNLLISGEKNFSIYLTWGGVALIAYLLKSILHGISTRCSHEATFHVLSELRRAVADKLTHVSMGYLTDTPSGRLKTTMVERVEQMEVPLAHIIPEMTANLLIPFAIVVYLFVLDWRMALVSLLTIPVGMLCYMAEMKEYPEKYGAVVRAGKHMSATTVEYINGIEVIKAFNQSAAILWKVYTGRAAERGPHDGLDEVYAGLLRSDDDHLARCADRRAAYWMRLLSEWQPDRPGLYHGRDPVPSVSWGRWLGRSF